MLFILSFSIPRVSAQIPEVPPPVIDQAGTERSWDISHPGWREKRAEAARQKEEARQLRLKKSQDAAKKKAEAKKRKQQAYAEAQRQKEENRVEQKREAEMEAKKRQKDKERKANALDMMKRFHKATAGVDLTASTDTNVNEIMYEQNALFVGILTHDAISPEEKRKHSLNLPIVNKNSPSVVRLDTMPPPSPLKQGGLMQAPPVNSDGPQDQNVNFDVPGLNNVSRLIAEVTDTLQSEAISEVKDFIIGSIQNPRVAIALEGGKIYSDFTLDVLKNTLEDIDNAVDFLSTQQTQTLNFIDSRKAQ